MPISEPSGTPAKKKSWLSRIDPVFRIALILGVLVHLAGFFIFRIERQELPHMETPEPFVNFQSYTEGGGAESLFEQAELLDTAALFMPSPYSDHFEQYSILGRAAEIRFERFDPEIQIIKQLAPESGISPDLPSTHKPEDLLNNRYWNFFSTVGMRSTRPVDAVSEDSPLILLRYTSAGIQAVSTESLPVFNAASGRLLSDPLEIYFSIDLRGFRSWPVVKQTSGSAAFDNEALEWLRQPSIRARLDSGDYLLRLFP